MAKKHSKYECSICHEKIDNKKKFIDHYKEEHPQEGYLLYDSIGTTGDAFTDNIILHFRKKIDGLEKNAVRDKTAISNIESKYREVTEKHNLLVFRYGKVASTISVITELVRSVKETVNTEITLKRGDAGLPVVREN